MRSFIYSICHAHSSWRSGAGVHKQCYFFHKHCLRFTNRKQLSKRRVYDVDTNANLICSRFAFVGMYADENNDADEDNDGHGNANAMNGNGTEYENSG